MMTSGHLTETMASPQNEEVIYDNWPVLLAWHNFSALWNMSASIDLENGEDVGLEINRPDGSTKQWANVQEKYSGLFGV